MAFSPRTSCPNANNPWWTHTSRGGKSPCIHDEQLKNCAWKGATISNCFVGDTQVLTDIGMLKLRDHVGETHNVLCIDNTWRPATFNRYEPAKVYEVRIGNTIYHCSGNHRWPIFSQTNRLKGIVTTAELKPGMKIRRSLTDEIQYPYIREGIQHGFIFGDGSIYNKKYSSAAFCGVKKDFMPQYFSEYSIHEWSCGTLGCNTHIVGGKNLPSIDKSVEYLYSFMVGYFAADGSVDATGSTYDISCKDGETLEAVRNILCKLRIRCGKVATRMESGYTGVRPMSYLSIYKQSLTSEFFLNPEHRRRFELKKKKNKRLSNVEYVQPTEMITDMYCVREPITETFCLGDGHLTCNCVGYAWGRFSEILGYPMSNSGAPNAGMWYTNYATNFQRGRTPQVGAVGCFSKPNEAGHVLIVEAVYPDGSILTSESSYSGSAFFSQRRYPPNYMAAPYQFQGFIYNPNVSGTVPSGTTSSGIMQDSSTELPLVRDLSEFTDFTGFDLRARLGDDVYDTLFTLGLIVVYKIGDTYQELLKTDQINKYIYSNMYTSYNTRNDAVGREAGYWDMSGMKPSIISTGHQLSAMNYTPLLEDIWSNVREKFSYYQLVDASGNAVSSKFGKGQTATSSGHIASTVPVLDSGYIPTQISTSTSNLDSRPRIVVEFFQGKGLPVAIGVGIAANIDSESKFRTDAVGDSGTSFGICQWHNERGTAMKSYCNNYGGDWANNFTGQLEYLWYELNHYSYLGFPELKVVPNTLQGAKQAADIFVRKFERPSDVEGASERRQAKAQEYWNSIVRYL